MQYYISLGVFKSMTVFWELGKTMCGPLSLCHEPMEAARDFPSTGSLQGHSAITLVNFQIPQTVSATTESEIFDINLESLFL